MEHRGLGRSASMCTSKVRQVPIPTTGTSTPDLPNPRCSIQTTPQTTARPLIHQRWYACGTRFQQVYAILSEPSLRATSKEPHLVASSAWVADPSQAQDDSQPVEAPNVQDAVLRRSFAG